MEPCYLARHNGEYEAPRAILARLTRDAPLEFELRREKAKCCGAGGARMWMEETIARRINVARVEQALPEQTMKSDGAKSLGRESEIATRDIAELVADALAECSNGLHVDPDQTTQCSMA